MIKSNGSKQVSTLIPVILFLMLLPQIEFAGQPNLTVSVSPVAQYAPKSPNQFYENSHIVFKAVVRNSGDAPAPASKLRFRIVNRSNITPWDMSTPGVSKDFPVPALHPNTMTEIKMTHVIKNADHYRIHVFIDFEKRIPEISEDNKNEDDFQVVQKVVDISPYKVETYWIGPGNSKWKPSVGHKTQVVVTIMNTGNTTFPASQLRVDFVKSGKGALYFKVPLLGEGKTFSKTLIHRYNTRGNKTVRVFVDWGNKTVETNENNNRKDFNFKVHLKPQ